MMILSRVQFSALSPAISFANSCNQVVCTSDCVPATTLPSNLPAFSYETVFLKLSPFKITHGQSSSERQSVRILRVTNSANTSTRAEAVPEVQSKRTKSKTTNELTNSSRPGNAKKASKKELNSVEEREENKPAVHLFQFPSAASEAHFQLSGNEEELRTSISNYVVKLSQEAIEARGSFTVVLSGGSLVKTLATLAGPHFFEKVDWGRWHVFWVDERVVPLTHPDSNYKLAQDELLSKVPIPSEQIHPIDLSAATYEKKLRGLVRKKVVASDARKKFPRFDLILLGIGTDGHVASLFPNSPLLAEMKRWVVPVTKSSKPPPKRISMTLACINSASHVAFVVVGSSKAEILQRVLERAALPGALPAQLVRLVDGQLTWFADGAAGSNLSIDSWSDPKKFPSFDWSSLKQSECI